MAAPEFLEKFNQALKNFFQNFAFFIPEIIVNGRALAPAVRADLTPAVVRDAHLTTAEVLRVLTAVPGRVPQTRLQDFPTK